MTCNALALLIVLTGSMCLFKHKHVLDRSALSPQPQWYWALKEAITRQWVRMLMSPPRPSSKDLRQQTPPQYYKHTIIILLRENQWKWLLFIRCYEKYKRVVFWVCYKIRITKRQEERFHLVPHKENIQGRKSCRKDGTIKCIQLIESLKLPILLNFHVRS